MYYILFIYYTYYIYTQHILYTYVVHICHQSLQIASFLICDTNFKSLASVENITTLLKPILNLLIIVVFLTLAIESHWISIIYKNSITWTFKLTDGKYIDQRMRVKLNLYCYYILYYIAFLLSKMFKFSNNR